MAGGALLVISLPDSKRSKRTNITEQVLIHDRGVVALTASICWHLGNDECIYAGSFKDLTVEYQALSALRGVAR